MSRSQRRLITLLALILAVTAALFSSMRLLAQVAQDRAVELKPIIAEPLPDGRVYLEWETGREEDSVGFAFIRAVSPTLPIYPNDLISITYESQATTFVPALSPSGATYLAYDESAQAGQVYNYVIVELDTSDQITSYYNFQVTVTMGDFAFADVVVTPAQSDVAGAVNTTVPHTLTVSNNGNRVDEIRLSVVSREWPTVPSTNFLALEPGESVDVPILVGIPANPTGCARDVATVEFISTGVFSSTDVATATLTTHLPNARHCLFTPLVTK